MAACRHTNGHARVLQRGVVWSLAAAVAAAAFAPAPVQAVERKFVVWLANVPKSGTNSNALPNRNAVSEQYFDETKPNVTSFAEYWEEISYGQVTISGDVFGWLNLPWPVLPDGVTSNNTGANLPFTNLSESSVFFYGLGEEFDESKQMFQRDTAAGLVDVPGVADGIWTPGERFMDLDNDGAYDGLFEPVAADEDANFCPGEFNDINGDGQRQTPEPFEDFLIRWDGFEWVPVTAEYVINNYPVGAAALSALLPQRGIELEGLNLELRDDTTNPPTWAVTLPDDQFSDADLNLPVRIIAVDGSELAPAESIFEDFGQLEFFESAPDVAVSPFFERRDPDGDPTNPPEWNETPVFFPDLFEPIFFDDPDNGTEGFCDPGFDQWFDGDNDSSCDFSPGDTIFFDHNQNGVIDPFGDRLIDPALPNAQQFDRGSDGDASTIDADGTQHNGQWDPGEPVELDFNSDGICNPGTDRWYPGDLDQDCKWSPAVTGGGALSGEYIIVGVDGERTILIQADLPLGLNGATLSVTRQLQIADGPGSGARIQPGSSDPADAEFRNLIFFGFQSPVQIGPEDDGAFLVIEGTRDGINDGKYVISRGSGLIWRGRGATVEHPSFRAYEGEEPDLAAFEEFGELSYPASDSDDEAGIDFVDRNCDELYQDGFLDPVPTVTLRGRMIINPFDSQLGGGAPARTGNGEYDGPDSWSEVGNTKMIVRDDLLGPPQATFMPTWLEEFWVDRYGGPAPGGAVWRIDIPAVQEFDPATARDFGPNSGGADGGGAIPPDETGDILPDAIGFYDGPVEFDDLPSSIYHAGGDLRLGEVTSPWNDFFWGQDLGAGPSVPLVDGLINAAGPLASRIHGDGGFDGGNLLNLELMTRRTDGRFPTEPDFDIFEALRELPVDRLIHPLLSSPTHPGYRDWNLDGLVDQGETREAGTENYAVDPYSATINNGYNGLYPFNRRRLVEDAVEASDRQADWDRFVLAGNAAGVTERELVLAPGASLELPSTIHTGTDGNFSTDDITNFMWLFGSQAGPGGFSNNGIYQIDEVLNNGASAVVSLVLGINQDGRVLTDPGPAFIDAEVLDETIATVLVFTPNRQIQQQISGIVILPADAGSGELFRRPAPALGPVPFGSYIEIQTRDADDPYVFSDLVSGLDASDETGTFQNPSDPTINFLTAFAAHEYLHTWEGLPDLYDYDVFPPVGRPINRPVGRWDVMAEGGLVHPTPILKSVPGWIEPVNLKTVLTPDVAQEVILPPSEFLREDVFFYFRNPIFSGDPDSPTAGEQFWFWSVTNQGFNRNLPGTGMMIMHTDLGENVEGLPSGQRLEDRFTYLIVQADGLHELEAGHDTNNNPDSGDDGDPFPGIADIRQWNVNTDPDNKWNDDDTDAGSGIDILDINVMPNGGHRVTFLWSPREVPSFDFINPPGGQVDGALYPVRYEVFDLFGGTTIEFFLDDDIEDGLYDGVALPGGRASKQAGRERGSFKIDVTKPPFDADGEGTYYLYAKLHLGPGADDRFDRAVSNVRASNNNTGDGNLLGPDGATPLSDTDVDPNSSKVEVWTMVCTDASTPGSEVWSVTGTLSGTQADAVTGQPYTTDGGEVSFQIVAGATNFAVDDRFLFLTTGLTDYSAALRIVNNDVVPPPLAKIICTGCSGPAPLEVFLDGSTSEDGLGNILGGQGTYAWNFGDGTTGTGPTILHSFAPAGTYRVKLTVTFDGQIDTETVDVVVGNLAPVAVIDACTEAACDDGGIPVPANGELSMDANDQATVFFSGAASNDPNGDTLTYAWDFGDGSPIERTAVPAPHVFNGPGLFNVKLTVTDETGTSVFVSKSLTLRNRNPIITVNSPLDDPVTGTAVLTVNFDLLIEDADGDVLDIQWTFGDGQTGTGNPVSHPYRAGTFIAKVTVTDGKGGLAEKTFNIEVSKQDGGPPPPGGGGAAVDPDDVVPAFTIEDANGNPVTEGAAPFEVVLDAGASLFPSGFPVTFEWNFGDGKTAGPGPVPTLRRVPHTYILLGNLRCTFTLRVGSVIKSISKDIRVLSGEPSEVPGDQPFEVTLTANPSSGPSPLNVTFGVSTDETVAQYEWSFGDRTPNSIGTQASLSHTYERQGSYTASVKVTSTTGEVARASQTILVTSDARGSVPEARITADPSVGAAPLQVQFSGLGSSDPDNDPLTYAWDFGDDGDTLRDGADATGPTPTHLYSAPGVYLVTLEVTDATGQKDEAVLQVDVKPATSVPTTPPSEPGPGNPIPPFVLCPFLSPLMLGLTLVGLAGMRFGYGSRRRI